MLLLIIALSADPSEPPSLDAESRARIARIEQRLDALEARAKSNCTCQPDSTCCSGNCPDCKCVKAPASLPAQFVKAVETGAPTYHYIPPANMKIENGAVVLDRQPSHISYPGQPMQPLPQATTPIVQPQTYYAPQPQFFAPPMPMFGGPMRFGGACVGRS